MAPKPSTRVLPNTLQKPFVLVTVFKHSFQTQVQRKL